MHPSSVRPDGGIDAPEAFAEVVTIQALARFLASLGRPDFPVVIFLDDCQWADQLAIRLLRRCQQHEWATGHPYVSVVASFRDEEIPHGHALRRLAPDAHVTLRSFSPDQIKLLVESMAGVVPDAVHDVVVELADGSPFMASAVVRGLVESEVLRPSSRGWEYDESRLDTLQSSRDTGQLLASRISLLPESSRALLRVGAVLGKVFSFDLAVQLSGLSHLTLEQAAYIARQRNLIWARSDGLTLAFVHDKIRESLLSEMSHDERIGLHRAAADHLRQESEHRASEIAYHYDQAEEPGLALPFALEAAKAARTRYALDLACVQYQIATHGCDGSDVATAFQVHQGYGDVLMLLGRYDAADEVFLASQQYARSNKEHAAAHAKLAELAFKRGDMERATRGFEAALRMLGVLIPRWRWLHLLLLLWHTFVQVGHTFFPKLLTARQRRKPNEMERDRIRLLGLLSHGCWYSRSKVECLSAHLRGMNFAEQFVPTHETAQVYSEHAPGMCLVGLLNRAERYARRSLELRKEFGDTWGQGQSLTFYCCVLFAASKFHQAVTTAREAIQLLERTGDYWQVHIARYQLAASLMQLGECQEAATESEINYRSGLEMGDELASGIIFDVWARATGGVIPPHTQEKELQRVRTDVQGSTQVQFGHGIVLLEKGDTEEAVRVLTEAVEISRRAGICNSYTLPPTNVACFGLATIVRTVLRLSNFASGHAFCVAQSDFRCGLVGIVEFRETIFRCSTASAHSSRRSKATRALPENSYERANVLRPSSTHSANCLRRRRNTRASHDSTDGVTTKT